MINRFEYVRQFEHEEILLPNTWIVVRIDGRGFHKLSSHYQFNKPNDIRALDLMNVAAQHTLRTIPEIIIAYGHSDEYSFVFHKSTTLFERRQSKLTSTIVSTFTAAYVHSWPEYFDATKQVGNRCSTDPVEGPALRNLDIDHLPTFDARAVCYPSVRNLRDYLSWRQADCHINNLYNTTFWALVQKGGMANTEAEEFLKGTFSSDKNEILFSRFGINYNNELDIFKKGSTVLREYKLLEMTSEINDAELDEKIYDTATSKTQQEKMRKARQKARVIVCHLDIIRDEFWDKRPWLLSGKPGIPES